MLPFLKMRKRPKPKALEFSVLCSMLHFSSGDMVRCLRFGSLNPPWQKSIETTATSAVRPSSRDLLDLVHIDGGLDEVWMPASRFAVSESTLHVLVNFTVSFTLSDPLDVECIKASFEGSLNVQFTEPVPFLRLEWMLWDRGLLPAGKRYEFEVVAEIPSTAPCSLETRLGAIDYRFVLSVEGLRDRCLGPRVVSKGVKVLNPYLVFDIPRVNLSLGNDDDAEMIGATIDVRKDLIAFVRFLDQFVTGTPLSTFWIGADRRPGVSFANQLPILFEKTTKFHKINFHLDRSKVHLHHSNRRDQKTHHRKKPNLKTPEHFTVHRRHTTFYPFIRTSHGPFHEPPFSNMSCPADCIPSRCWPSKS